MTLIQCPECRNQVSSAALSCPYCGYPIATLNQSQNQQTQTLSEPCTSQTSATTPPPPPNKSQRYVLKSTPNANTQTQQPFYETTSDTSPQKKKGCFGRSVKILIVFFIILFVVSGIANCSAGPDKDSLWYQNLSSALQEVGIEDVDRIDTTVMLREEDKNGHLIHVTNGNAYSDYDNDEIYDREAVITTKSGRKIRAHFYNNDQIYELRDDEDRKTTYWALPDEEGDYKVDIISFETGAIIHPKNEEKAAAWQKQLEEYQAAQAAKPQGAEKTFVEDMATYYGWDEESSRNAYSLLCELGCSGAQVIGGSMTNNENLQAMRAEVNGHQINFTAENKVVFYVQITGWTETDYGW